MILTYVSSVKVLVRSPSTTGVPGSLGEEHARDMSACVLTSCCTTNSGYTFTKWVGPLDKIGNSVKPIENVLNTPKTYVQPMVYRFYYTLV